MPEANLFLLFTRRLNALGVRYMVSGSVAVIIYGEPRLTHDVDLVVALDDSDITRLPMLAMSPGLIDRAELDRQVSSRGLEEPWRRVQAS